VRPKPGETIEVAAKANPYELFSAGVFNNREFRDLEGLAQLRNVIVHGFSVPDFPSSAVEILLDVARRLLTESPASKKSA
jgi:hypothetical protein